LKQATKTGNLFEFFQRLKKADVIERLKPEVYRRLRYLQDKPSFFSLMNLSIPGKVTVFFLSGTA
jgi:hypothetical protein